MNIAIPESGCHWLKEAEEEKEKRYRRKANGRPRQFAFQVTNLCDAKADIRLDLALEGTLHFQTKECDVGVRPTSADGYLELSVGSLTPGARAVVTCDTRPYKKKKWYESGVTLRRTFRLAVTRYADQPVGPVFFDPEVVLEKSGEH